MSELEEELIGMIRTMGKEKNYERVEYVNNVNRRERYNPNTGLEFLRARYYNANQGRFFQEDTYLGDITDPLTLNRYAYVKKLRLKENGDFVSLYPGAGSERVINAIKNGDIVWP